VPFWVLTEINKQSQLVEFSSAYNLLSRPLVAAVDCLQSIHTFAEVPCPEQDFK